jgi:hypothetical protein
MFLRHTIFYLIRGNYFEFLAQQLLAVGNHKNLAQKLSLADKDA